MWRRSLNYGLVPLMSLLKGTTIIRFASNLGDRLKTLNDSKQFQQALQLFHQHQKNNTEILSSLTITQALKACTHLRDIQSGKAIHALVTSRTKDDQYIVTSLIHMYMQCGDISSAETVFHATETKDPSMYGAMMKGDLFHVQETQKAFEVFHEIQTPSEVNLIVFFQVCAVLKTQPALDAMKKMLQQTPTNFHSNHRLVTSLLNALVECGDVEHAEKIFDTINAKLLPMYGVMMKGYIAINQSEKAIDLFKKIDHPDAIITNLLFNGCAQLRTPEALNITKRVSTMMNKSFFENDFIVTSLLDALMKCGDVECAELIFSTIETKKTLPICAAMMKSFIASNQAQKAIDLFNRIDGPDAIITNLFFNACAQLRTPEALNFTKRVSTVMNRTLFQDEFIITSLLDALMKCGDVEHAELIFTTLETKKTLHICGAMMKGYIENNQADKAVDIFREIKNPDDVNTSLLFSACAQLRTPEALALVKTISKRMPASFYSDDYVASSLLDALIKCKDTLTAEIVFSKMKRSIVSYGNLMNGLNDEKQGKKTMQLFYRMKREGLEPETIIFLCVIKALALIGDLSLIEPTINQIPESILLDSQIRNALIDMWGKTGCVDKAHGIFENTSQRHAFLYTTMINCYGLNGMGMQALELFSHMPKQFIHEVTYICILNACSHSGLVDEARSIFQKIESKTPTVWTTMIDCLARASLFDEAQALIDEFERSHRAAIAMYMALLSGARNDKNAQLAQNIYDRMKTLFPSTKDPLTAAEVLLANTYASSGDIGKAADIRIQHMKSGVKKKIGTSTTVVDGEIYEFRAHDRSHPRSDEIYREVQKLSKELVAHGHEYDSSWITRAMGEDESVESVLCGHSERLAMAWNFLANPHAKRIQITKNLRVCGDCHRATKLIAAIRQCEIIVRDANRIHHFHKNGQCSCNDYF
ncbi:unnamed protein product [Adineta ricciae]|uniref:DYW domain-containing protein n=1 Tax=Adineta ricciae TaxID=249248 RepID=A0A815Q3G3_ADIRI|nr:unnamed protein product [Adineta ricciae]